MYILAGAGDVVWESLLIYLNRAGGADGAWRWLSKMGTNPVGGKPIVELDQLCIQLNESGDLRRLFESCKQTYS